MYSMLVQCLEISKCLINVGCFCSYLYMVVNIIYGIENLINSLVVVVV